jgi:hypothetical protein
VCKKIKFVGVVVFEKRFEAIVDSNSYTYERPWHNDRRRNSSDLKNTILGLKIYYAGIPCRSSKTFHR